MGCQNFVCWEVKLENHPHSWDCSTRGETQQARVRDGRQLRAGLLRPMTSSNCRCLRNRRICSPLVPGPLDRCRWRRRQWRTDPRSCQLCLRALFRQLSLRACFRQPSLRAAACGLVSRTARCIRHLHLMCEGGLGLRVQGCAEGLGFRDSGCIWHLHLTSQ